MTSKRKIAILLGSVVFCEIIFAFLIKEIASTSPGFEIFDMKLFYSITSFHDNLVLLQRESYNALILFKMLDTVFPVMYGLLLYIWLKHVHVTNKILLVIPLIGMTADLLENILLTFKTFFTNQYDFLIWFTNAFTIIKFTSIFISVILIIYFGKKGSGKNDNIGNETFID